MMELVREPQVPRVEIPTPIYGHLRRLTDAGGLYEHAEGTTPRPEHGYCLDDVARALVVVCREPAAAELDDLREQYLMFVLTAQEPDGRFHNRRQGDLTWSDTASLEDCWGRALWGLGTAVARVPHLRDRALAGFDLGSMQRSSHPRAMAFAALGAAEVLAVLPEHRQARALMTAVAIAVGRPAADEAWPWPQPRLTYANAALPEALLAAGVALDSPSLVADGLGLLGWLLDAQIHEGHLSVVPVGGRGPGESPSAFDQQPIEVAALADACARAHRIEGGRRWAEGVELAAAWFAGINDSDTPMHDPAGGGGFDGLMRGGRNENQGAESTLALLSTLQQSRSIALDARRTVRRSMRSVG
ncbi:hypothetical protein [Pseudonocardia charpentierae]|uniref:Glycosyltransferase n=1 Tax=Pseudonocardia charpentierae TaxID=3075545 RepID=A0ABU2N5H4_9PSEU|nr:hypothetical protein [Pseudonocardia sp. DSM 45834]MDT0347964.1 hypothetical protein [Pseudonocardia sp. DSM 45834]